MRWRPGMGGGLPLTLKICSYILEVWVCCSVQEDNLTKRECDKQIDHRSLTQFFFALICCLLSLKLPMNGKPEGKKCKSKLLNQKQLLTRRTMM